MLPALHFSSFPKGNLNQHPWVATARLLEFARKGRIRGTIPSRGVFLPEPPSALTQGEPAALKLSARTVPSNEMLVYTMNNSIPPAHVKKKRAWPVRGGPFLAPHKTHFPLLRKALRPVTRARADNDIRYLPIYADNIHGRLVERELGRGKRGLDAC